MHVRGFEWFYYANLSIDGGGGKERERKENPPCLVFSHNHVSTTLARIARVPKMWKGQFNTKVEGLIG